jgi:hypothetical protein
MRKALHKFATILSAKFSTYVHRLVTNVELTAIEYMCMAIILLHVIPQEYRPIILAYFSTTYDHTPLPAVNFYTKVAAVYFQASVIFLYLIVGK